MPEQTLTIGMIGLGKMGGAMSQRLLRAGHHVIGYDRDENAISHVVEHGARGVASVDELARELPSPRYVWMMVPAGDPVDATINALQPHLEEGDVLIDGGNSNYKDTLRRAEEIRQRGQAYVDVGVSGGVWGLENGYSLMVGGDEEVVKGLRPAFEALAPGAEKGWSHVGTHGAGHFTKMVHNGIEYGMMQALAEGFAVMEAKEEMELDLHQVAEVWRFGSVVQSWLLDLIARALEENPDLDGLAPYVPDSGEGRWTAKEAIDLDVPAPIITQSLIQRLQSRRENDYAHCLLSALRNQFGGHAVVREEGENG